FKQAAAHGVTKLTIYGYGHRVRAIIVLARVLWLSGAADRAAQVARQAVEEAELDEQPMSMFLALLYASTVFLWRGDIEESESSVSRLIEHVGRHSFGTNADFGTALSGEVALLRGEFRTAASRLRAALSALHVERRQILTNTLCRSMSEALFECGELLEAEAMITATVESAEVRHDAFDIPELLRTRAKIGVASGQLDQGAAESMLRRAVELANNQGALSLELRSATALGALLADDGRTEEAYTILVKVYKRFTEGHETRDLRKAKQFIETWRPAERETQASD